MRPNLSHKREQAAKISQHPTGFNHVSVEKNSKNLELTEIRKQLPRISNRIRLRAKAFHHSVKTMSASPTERYELTASNPPFSTYGNQAYPQTHAYFKNTFSLDTIKPREFQNVRFQFVTLPSLHLVILPTQYRKIKILPARSFVTKVFYLLFIFVQLRSSYWLVRRNMVDICPAPDFNTQYR